MVIFLNIETFKTFRKVVGGADEETVVGGEFDWKNLMLKWAFPMDSGNFRFDADVGLGPNEDQGKWVVDSGKIAYRERSHSRIHVRPKPAMFTGTAEKLVVFSLDYVINPSTPSPSLFGVATINPDVNNDGNDKIKKLTSEDGLTWIVDKDDGVVLDELEVELTPNDIGPHFTYSFLTIKQDDVFPAPFLLFNKANIA